MMRSIMIVCLMALGAIGCADGGSREAARAGDRNREVGEARLLSAQIIDLDDPESAPPEVQATIEVIKKLQKRKKKVVSRKLPPLGELYPTR